MAFIIGVFITVAEPDLIILAGQIKGVPDSHIIIAVSIGVGLALVVAFSRILFQLPLSYILIGSYLAAFVLSGLTSGDFLSIAWESGGVATGPILVPFVMAFGLGLASIRADKTSEEDSFGLVSLTLIVPIIAVLILGLFYSPAGGSVMRVPEQESFLDIVLLYRAGIAEYFVQIAIALFPMLFLFAIFQVWKLHLKTKAILKIATGTIYTYLGLVLFLASANIGFMPAGYQLGGILVKNTTPFVLILAGLVTGYFVVTAEPAVFVLKRQVEDVTEGVISGKSMGIGLSMGVAVSVGLAMIRVVTGLSILYFVIPGYIIAHVITFFIPPLFTSIAFDSGAVASGPLAATFLLPFAIGASEASGGNIYTDAFGIVAFIAMTPVITLSLFGLAYAIKSRIAEREAVVPAEDTIIDLYYSSDQTDEESDTKTGEISLDSSNKETYIKDDT